MNRREFLGTSVFAATAGLALDACAPDTRELIPILLPEEAIAAGEETFHPSACQECGAFCGILVRKIDGRLVKVEGNPAHPVSRGGVCPRGQALAQAMYHPDRIQSPLVREGERGSGAWKSVTWDEALERAAAEVAAALASDANPRIGFLTPELSGHREAMVQRFLTALGGGARYVQEPFSDRCDEARPRPRDGTRLRLRVRPRRGGLRSFVRGRAPRIAPIPRGIRPRARRDATGSPRAARQARLRGAASLAHRGERGRMGSPRAGMGARTSARHHRGALRARTLRS